MENYNLIIKILNGKPELSNMNREHLELLYKYITYELKDRINEQSK